MDDCGEKTMKWHKAGLIFPYTKELLNTKSHCQYPCPVQLSNEIYRVYFGSRDENNNTIIFHFDMNMKKQEIVTFSRNPILVNGPTGYFDCNGVYPSCVIKKDKQLWMYMPGFMRGEFPLYYTRIGLAVSEDGNQFTKYSNVPLLNVSEYDPWMLTGPFVMHDDGSFRMWYVSGYKWDEKAHDRPQSYYHIKYAESHDGLHWKREGLVSIDHAYETETNIGRPWIIKEKGVYKAWFSYACGKQGYRIGYAESTDGGYTFTRMDEKAGITISEQPWENEAIAYPAVIVYQGRKYMFYNGNQFGKEGIALAVSD